MTPSETSRLLMLIAGLDDRLSGDQQTIRNRVGAWAAILGPVDATWATGMVTRHYGADQKLPLTPGAILQRWDALPENRSRPELPTGGVPMPDHVREMRRQLQGSRATA